jgi:type IV secretory pathway VirD2 relaxase
MLGTSDKRWKEEFQTLKTEQAKSLIRNDYDYDKSNVITNKTIGFGGHFENLHQYEIQ